MNKEELSRRKKRATVIVRELKKLFPRAKIALNFSNRFELLVAVVLSAQCTDKKVNEVTGELFKKYKTIDDYARADLGRFELQVKPTGFFRNKAKNIINTAKIIKADFAGQVPNTMEKLVQLPGVARKTANIVLSSGFGKIEGIAVDTHVKRLARLHGLTSQSDPNKIEQDLMQLLPKKEWPGFNLRLIEYGRKYCPAKKHAHENCPLAVKLSKA